MGARGIKSLARGCGGIIPPRIKVYNSPSCGILPSTGKSLNTGRPPKRSEHGKHQIQSKRQTVFRGERKLQGAVGQAGESLQERIRREELQKLQVKFAKIKATDPVGRFDFLRATLPISARGEQSLIGVAFPKHGSTDPLLPFGTPPPLGTEDIPSKMRNFLFHKGAGGAPL